MHMLTRMHMLIYMHMWRSTHVALGPRNPTTLHAVVAVEVSLGLEYVLQREDRSPRSVPRAPRSVLGARCSVPHAAPTLTHWPTPY